MRVRINRGERRPPFLSNIVKGGAEQVAPNGHTFDTDPQEPDGIQGTQPWLPVMTQTWPGGNRSGE